MFEYKFSNLPERQNILLYLFFFVSLSFNVLMSPPTQYRWLWGGARKGLTIKTMQADKLKV